jgi:DinB superfamily
MTKAERDYLLSQLETTKAGMLASIKGLTPAQWTFKPAPDVWSVQECAEHIILAEDFIFSGSQKILTTPAGDRLATATAEDDRKLVARIEDRSVKAKAPEPIVPSGKFPNPQSAAQEFTTRRDNTIAYVKSTEDPLRIHSAPGPAGTMDAYQFLLLLAAHSARHTAQIREVEADPQYPKASTYLMPHHQPMLAFR